MSTALRLWPHLIAAAVLSTASGWAQEADAPYRDFSSEGSGFLGARDEAADPGDLTSIRIGVTGPAQTEAGRQLLAAVQLAVDEANADGGYDGVPYEIAFRANDGPWGVVARQVVDLVVEDDVWAIIGALDGERAHAAELVVAKLWVPVLTPAGDHTIDYANVPWVFRGSPDDLSQVEALLDLAIEHGWRRLVLISEIWRDAEQAAGRLQRRARERGLQIVLHHRYETYHPGQSLDHLVRQEADAAVVWGRPFSAAPLLRDLRALGVTCPLLLPSVLAVPEIAALPVLEPAIAVAPFRPDGDDPELAAFRKTWAQRRGSAPRPVAVVAYDMARFTLEAMSRSGLSRARLRDELARGGYRGLSGPFDFNSLGGRLLKPVAVVVRDGQWRSP